MRGYRRVAWYFSEPCFYVRNTFFRAPLFHSFSAALHFDVICDLLLFRRTATWNLGFCIDVAPLTISGLVPNAAGSKCCWFQMLLVSNTASSRCCTKLHETISSSGRYVLQVSMIHGFVPMRNKQAHTSVTGNNLWDMNVYGSE